MPPAPQKLLCGADQQGVFVLSSSASIVPVPLQLARAEANGEVVRRKPGRPRKIRQAPSLDELELARIENEERDEYVRNDALVQTLEVKAPPAEILRHVLQELAVESAAIRHEIRSAQAAARSDGQPQRMSRRIDALSKMAAVVLETRKLGLDEPDLRSDPVQRVFGLFLTTIEEVARETLTDSESFVSECRQALDGWETRV